MNNKTNFFDETLDQEWTIEQLLLFLVGLIIFALVIIYFVKDQGILSKI